MILWAVACKAPLFLEFSRKAYWSWSPFLSPGDLPKPGIKPGSPAQQADSLPSELPGKPKMQVPNSQIQCTFHYIQLFVKQEISLPSKNLHLFKKKTPKHFFP